MRRLHILLLAIAALAISGCASAPQREKYPYTYIGGLKLVYAYLDDNQYNRRYKLPAPMAKIKQSLFTIRLDTYPPWKSETA